jgi:hypothetical protein
MNLPESCTLAIPLKTSARLVFFRPSIRSLDAAAAPFPCGCHSAVTLLSFNRHSSVTFPLYILTR